MASETTIVNEAMRLLKTDRITSLTDGSTAANAAKDVYVEIRDDLLAGHPWNFGSKFAKLAQITATPIFEFDNAYSLPADWLRTVTVHDNDGGFGTLIYREAEVDGVGVIATSVDEMWMRYVYRVTDPNRMSAGFRAALSYALALAMPGISNLSAAREDRLAGRAEGKLRRAKHMDATGSMPERRPAGSWITSRGGGIHGHDWPR